MDQTKSDEQTTTTVVFRDELENAGIRAQTAEDIHRRNATLRYMGGMEGRAWQAH